MIPRTAMILAAGYGSRLAPITDQLPKPLIPFLGRPVLFRTLDRLAALGVRRFVINAHHLAEPLVRAVEGARRRSWGDVRLIREPEILGTGGGILNARPLLAGRGDVLVVNGDVVFDHDLRRLTRAHRRQGNLATLLLVRPRGRDELLKVAFSQPGGEISAFDGRAEAGQELAAFSGIHVLSEQLLDALPFEAGARACIVHDGYRHLLGEGRVRGLFLRGFWADLGTPEDYLSTHLLALGRGLPDHEEIRYEQPRERIWVRRGARIDPSVRLDPPVIIGRGVRVEAGASIGPGVVLGDEAVIEAGSRLRASVVFPRVRVVGKHVHEILFESPTIKYHEGVHDNPEGGTS